MHLMNPPLATRRSKAPNRQHRLQRLPCPACKCERLIDTGFHTISKTFVFGEVGYDTADYYQKCHSCRNSIGIQKLNTASYT